MTIEFQTKYAFLKNVVSLTFGAIVTTFTFSYIFGQKFPDWQEFKFIFFVSLSLGTFFGFIVYFLIPYSLKLKLITPMMGGLLVPIFPALLIVQNLQFALTMGWLGAIYATSSWLVWMKLRNEKIRIFK